MTTPNDSNLALWNAVSTTDPSHTRHVGQRGGFTAIDAYYQIQQATKQFGPVGEGWGWDLKDSTVEANLFIVVVELWWASNEQPRSFPVFGCSELISSKGRADADAPKKALTDAITKGLSYLGFNADVFMGKFDDSKYVTRAAIDTIKDAFENAAHPLALKTMLEDRGKDIKGLSKAHQDELRRYYQNRMKELEDQEVEKIPVS